MRVFWTPENGPNVTENVFALRSQEKQHIFNSIDGYLSLFFLLIR